MKDFRKSCVYQIYLKSFCDMSGNGLGDLQGVISKLSYLQRLGIDYLWLTPFFISPQNDNGYDVSDYRSIDKNYGTKDDLDELIAKAKECNIGIMLDMVFNHTSTENKWFQEAVNGNEYYKDFYIFKDGKEDGSEPTNWQSKFGGSAWEYVKKYDQYYLHLFDKTQADLNWDNPNVRNELVNIIKFWIKKGVEGFRFDVVNLISKPEIYQDDLVGDGKRFYTDGHRIHDYLKELFEQSGLNESGMVTVGEMSSTSIEHCIRYSNPDEKEFSMCFNFHHLKVDYKDQNKWELQDCDFMQLKSLLNEWQLGMQVGNGWNAVFWCNHDQPRIISRFGNDKKYHLESGKMLATMIHLLRGTPYIYQGEEIGMTNAYFTDLTQYRDVESLNYFQILKESGMEDKKVYHILQERSRDNARTPMQWDCSKNAGFTKGIPWIHVNPNYRKINVESSIKDEQSLFYHYQKLIALRKEYDVISYGDYQPILEENKDVFAFIRRYGNQTLLVLNNFFGHTAEVTINHDLKGEYQLLLHNYEARSLKKNMILKPYESVVFIQ